MLLMYGLTTYTFYLLGLSVESEGEGIVVSSVEEGRLAHVQGIENNSICKMKTKRFWRRIALDFCLRKRF